MKSFKQFSEEFTFKVDVEGLPSMFMKGNSPGEVKSHLRKLVKQPSMVQGVKRVTKHDKKKEFRKRAMGEEVSHSQDEGKPGARKKAAEMTPGQKNENRRDRLRAKFAAVGKDMEKTNNDLKKTMGIKDEPKQRLGSDGKPYKSKYEQDSRGATPSTFQKFSNFVMRGSTTAGPKGATPSKKSSGGSLGKKINFPGFNK